VAIDGPAGSGKSTLARRLASELGVPYVNTGLMYRAITAAALRRGLDVDDGVALGELARELRFDLDFSETPATLLIEGAAPGEDLVAPEVEAAVSAVSRHPEVRRVMAAEQRRLGAAGAVMEGRDIGSVIFPDADVKLFLQAAGDERILRRERERGDAAAEGVIARDARDARVNPFVPTAGAVTIDTTGKTKDQAFAEALDAIRRPAGGGDG
jgi:cytidylate kinase